jgi:sulfide dehydrogenase cytochrome subunit
VNQSATRPDPDTPPAPSTHVRRMRHGHTLTLGLAASLTLLGTPGTAAAQGATGPDPLRAGAYLAANCANCHGTAGQATSALPGLAGMPREGFIQAMKDYREGRRNPTIMHQLAKGYSDEQIALMAEFFARQKAK